MASRPAREIISEADMHFEDMKAQALKQYINRLSPNLLRAYVLDMVEGAPPAEIEKLVVAFKAQNDVPRGG